MKSIISLPFRSYVSVYLILVFAISISSTLANTFSDQLEINNSEVGEDTDSLVVLWTTADREVALKMLCMYTFNAKKYKWWEDIVVIVWGPSAKLLSEDVELQEYFQKLMDAGVRIKACKGCSDQYEGVSEKLSSLGIEVLYVGKEFTDYLKSTRKILTL